MTEIVFVTGVSGFLGGQITMDLLDAGYHVRGSIRNPQKENSIRENFKSLGKDISRLEFVTLDLLKDAGWDDALKNCHHLIHVASPFVTQIPKDKNELIEPAVNGTVRAISAALKADIKRIVLTSSTVAITQGHPKTAQAHFSGKDWTNLQSADVMPYPESKTRAEMAAWDLMKNAGRSEDLVVINPGFITGPLHNTDPGTSGTILLRFLKGDMPAIPNMSLITTDVRDVSKAHIAALTTTQFAGKRIPISSGSLTFKELADILRDAFPAYAKSIPTRSAPDFLVRILALFDRDIRGNLCELGVYKTIDNSDAISLMGSAPTPVPDAITAMTQSLIDYGLAPKP
ncbi:NAD-dependent epimerase/dehydratase family protein [Hirschia litorea]|uniref:NAD-dependent epimerase/dehydratase family protein n=1 Tax=Hirschia litorea TaxID=1199156 RepID=A0ABW2IL59_9PROT